VPRKRHFTDNQGRPPRQAKAGKEASKPASKGRVFNCVLLADDRERDDVAGCRVDVELSADIRGELTSDTRRDIVEAEPVLLANKAAASDDTVLCSFQML
jgi:hypothetical protein